MSPPRARERSAASWRVVLDGAFLFAASCGGGSSGSRNTPPPPPVSQSFPPALSLTDATSVTVRGTADVTRVSVVRVNGVDASSSDAFATWHATLALALGDNPIHVDAVEPTGTVLRDVAGGTARRIGPLLDPKEVAVDPATGRLVVLDQSRQALYAIDPSSGAGEAITSSDHGIGPRIDDARGLVLDTAGDLAWVVDAATHAVVEIDVTTGDRTVLSDAALGSGPILVHPVDAAHDAGGGRLLVVDDGLGGLLSIDLVTGDRTILADAARGVGPAFSTLLSVAFDAAGGSAIVGQRDATSSDVLEVDPASGDRILLSGTDRGAGPPFTVPIAVALDPASGALLLLNSSWSTDPGLLGVDHATGDRVEICGPTRGSGPALYFGQDVAIDSARAFAVNPADLGLLAIELGSGDRSRVGTLAEIGGGAPLSHVPRIEVDPRTPRAYAADDGLGAIVSIDVTSGDRSILADASHGRGGPFRPSAIAIDPDRSRLILVAWLDGDGDASVLAVDLATGERTILSHPPTIGSGVPFDTPSDAALDADQERLFVLDTVQHRVVAVDLATGARTVLSSDVVGTGPQLAIGTALALDAGRGRLLVAQDASLTAGGFPPLLTIDLATGDRAVLPDPTPLDGVELERASDLAFDRANDRVLALDRGSIYSIDAGSGERSLHVDGGRTDLGPSLFQGEALALDAGRGTALVVGSATAFRGLASVVVTVDLESTQRAVLSIAR